MTMSDMCKGDWRCRRLCKLGRATTRIRPRCLKTGSAACASAIRIERNQSQAPVAANQSRDVAMRLAAE